MQKSQLFQYAIIWHPTEKQIESGDKPKLIVGIKSVLAKDLQSCQMMAAMEIPAEYREFLDQVDVVISPF